MFSRKLKKLFWDLKSKPKDIRKSSISNELKIFLLQNNFIRSIYRYEYNNQILHLINLIKFIKLKLCNPRLTLNLIKWNYLIRIYSEGSIPKEN